MRPEVPKDYSTEQKLKADWDAFVKQCHESLQKLSEANQRYGNSASKKAMQSYEDLKGKTANEIIVTKLPNLC